MRLSLRLVCHLNYSTYIQLIWPTDKIYNVTLLEHFWKMSLLTWGTKNFLDSGHI
jgi:hypothetical protein